MYQIKSCFFFYLLIFMAKKLTKLHNQIMFISSRYMVNILNLNLTSYIHLSTMTFNVYFSDAALKLCMKRIRRIIYHQQRVPCFLLSYGKIMIYV